MMPIVNHKQISYGDAASMLQSVPAFNREIWIRVGMALKHEFGEEGWTLFNEWSQTSHNYDPLAATYVWRSFQGTGVSIGTLIYLAKKHGYSGSHSSRPSLKPPQNKSAVKRQTSDYAKRLFLSATKTDQAVSNHPYSLSKGIRFAASAGRGKVTSRRVGENSDCLIIPIRDIRSNRVQGVQIIDPHGIKQTFGQLSSGALILGNTNCLEKPWLIVEGWASAVSVIFDHKKDVCVCSFGKTNQDKVAKIIADVYRPSEVFILREDDR